MEPVIKTKVTDYKDFTEKYLAFWKGLFDLTQREQDTLVEFLLIRKELEESGIQEPILTVEANSTQSRRRVRSRLGFSRQSITNILTTLSQKKALHKGLPHPMLIPKKSFTITFEDGA